MKHWANFPSPCRSGELPRAQAGRGGGEGNHCHCGGQPEVILRPERWHCQQLFREHQGLQAGRESQVSPILYVTLVRTHKRSLYQLLWAFRQ